MIILQLHLLRHSLWAKSALLHVFVWPGDESCFLHFEMVGGKNYQKNNDVS